MTLDVKYKDKEGDNIVIRKPSHLRQAVKMCLESDGVLRLHLIAPENGLSAIEDTVLESLVAAVVVIDKRGKILVFTGAAEKLFGYGRKEVIGKNVKVLMNDRDGEAHDAYIKSYLRSGDANVIGTGRQVVAKRKDDSTFAVHLSVSENRADNHHTFCATITPIQTIHASSSSTPTRESAYSLLESILDIAIVINEQGIVQFFNKRAEVFFGYSRTEVVGRNVKLLMPSPHQEVHDQYIQNYLKTGVAKVIGTGRDVIAQLKDGTIIPVNLSIGEGQKSDGLRIFTGLLRPIEESAQPSKSILQHEREVLDNLLVPAIVIDEKGIIHAFNGPSQEMFGYSLLDVVGKNVKMLMPSPDKNRHDMYLENYLKTGKAKVIGTGRDVVGLQKDGSMVALRLSVTERSDGDKKIFTGVLQKLK